MPGLRVPRAHWPAALPLGTPTGAASGTSSPGHSESSRSSRPGLRLLLTEPARAGLDLASLLATSPAFAAAPRGDGHPVLVLPGLLTGDPQTLLLRNALRLLGHQTHSWGLGTNRGATGRVVASLRDRVQQLQQESGRRVSIVGWSLGGVYAQELARASPSSVRQLVTLGSPVLRRRTWVQDLSRFVDQSSHLSSLTGALPRPWSEPGPLRVPATSVYTRSDGVVDWRVCRVRPAARREDVEVRGSHLGLVLNPAVLWLLADRLAQPEGSWAPFRPPALLRPLYPRTR